VNNNDEKQVKLEYSKQSTDKRKPIEELEPEKDSKLAFNFSQEFLYNKEKSELEKQRMKKLSDLRFTQTPKKIESPSENYLNSNFSRSLKILHTAKDQKEKLHVDKSLALGNGFQGENLKKESNKVKQDIIATKIPMDH